MATGAIPLKLQTGMEDVLAHLPMSGTTEYAKGQIIYGPDLLSNSIYLLVAGQVGILRTAEDNSEVLLDIVRPDEVFGESAFLNTPRRSERAIAIEKSKLMTWAVSEMEGLVMKRPRLAVALLQIMAQRNAEFARRIESFSIDSVERRLARSLLRFSERLGTPGENDSVLMRPFTHVMLAQYVGTSREIVTHYMNHFRKLGYVKYSRQGILLHRDSLGTVLSHGGVTSTGAVN